MMPMPPRARYLALAAATIVVGLAVHRSGGVLPMPRAARDVLGDAIWAVMMWWWVGAVAPAARLPARGAAAVAICFAFEFGQLYRAPWIDALRRTTLGRLALGTDFDPRDLAAYAAGVLAAALAEHLLTRDRRT